MQTTQNKETQNTYLSFAPLRVPYHSSTQNSLTVPHHLSNEVQIPHMTYKALCNLAPSHLSKLISCHSLHSS